jgi:hypothetical protein
MRKLTAVLMTIVTGLVVIVSATGAAHAEPGKNQIEATASCSNGETYTFVLNGMGKAWQLESTNSNLIVKSYTLTYYEPGTSIPKYPFEDTYGRDENANGQEDDLVRCEGEVTTVLEAIGEVRVVAEFEAFVTPRGGE